MPTVGTQIILCDCPLRTDTYTGCKHGCTYCFATRIDKERNERDPELGEKPDTVRNWIEGKRDLRTNWIDFKLPIHMGGLSDPLQPCEAKYKNTYEVLKVFADTQYPLILSTKGALLATKPYVDLLSKCSVVVQISMCCSGYDKMERGAPNFNQRLKMAKVISDAGMRVVARCQPFMPEYGEEIIKAVGLMAQAGIHGVVVEGLKAFEGEMPAGMVKVAGDTCYPLTTLTPWFKRIRDAAHAGGMKFYAGENRLRAMGDSLCCCGCEDVEGFEPNRYNLNHLLYDDGKPCRPSPAQAEPGTADVFASLSQDSTSHYVLKGVPFATVMKEFALNRNARRAMGCDRQPEQTSLL